MHLDKPAEFHPARRARRSLGDRLRTALQELIEDKGEIRQHSERPWASITFNGTRHKLRIQFEGAEQVAVGESFIAQLPEHEFTIAGQLVAEAKIAQVDHQLSPTPQMQVECEILLIEDV